LYLVKLSMMCNDRIEGSFLLEMINNKEELVKIEDLNTKSGMIKFLKETGIPRKILNRLEYLTINETILQKFNKEYENSTREYSRDDFLLAKLAKFLNYDVLSNDKHLIKDLKEETKHLNGKNGYECLDINTSNDDEYKREVLVDTNILFYLTEKKGDPSWTAVEIEALIRRCHNKRFIIPEHIYKEFTRTLPKVRKNRKKPAKKNHIYPVSPRFQYVRKYMVH